MPESDSEIPEVQPVILMSGFSSFHDGIEDPDVRVQLHRCPAAEEAVSHLNIAKGRRIRSSVRQSRQGPPIWVTKPIMPSTVPATCTKRCFICQAIYNDNKQCSPSLQHLEKLFLFKKLIFSSKFSQSLPPESKFRQLDNNNSCASCETTVDQLWDLQRKLESIQESIQTIIQRTRQAIRSTCLEEERNGIVLDDPGRSPTNPRLNSKCLSPPLAKTPFRTRTIQASPSPSKTHFHSGAEGLVFIEDRTEDDDVESLMDFDSKLPTAPEVDVTFKVEVPEHEYEDPSVHDFDAGEPLRDLDQYGISDTSRKVSPRKGLSVKINPVSSYKQETKVGLDLRDSFRTEYSKSKDLKDSKTEENYSGTSDGEDASSDNDNSSYKCASCNMTFKTSEQKKYHVRKVHRPKPDKKYKCEMCPAEYNDASSLSYHRHTMHLKTIKFTCEYCPMKFYHRTMFIRHTQTHTGEKPFACSKCNKKFSTKAYLKMHEKIICGSNEELLKIRKEKQRKNVATLLHKCPQLGCQKGFTSEDKLKAHLEICSSSGPDRAVCEICGISVTKSYLRKHKKAVHDRTKNYQCHKCNKAFTLKNEFTRHFKRMHVGENRIPNVKCEKCEKLFVDVGGLTRHLKFVHQKIRNWECPTCQKKFVTPKDLTRHIMTHSGERPFVCSKCNRGFIRQDNLRNHQKTSRCKIRDPNKQSKRRKSKKTVDSESQDEIITSNGGTPKATPIGESSVTEVSSMDVDILALEVEIAPQS